MRAAAALAFLALVRPVAASAGCTDSAATNYDPAASSESGDCEYDCATLQQKVGALGGHSFSHLDAALLAEKDAVFAHVYPRSMTKLTKKRPRSESTRRHYGAVVCELSGPAHAHCRFLLTGTTLAKREEDAFDLNYKAAD